ncbi:MAG: hypothetical protein LBD02_09260 [Christensenellaceae bacterium]|jgi:hypothetical protein|nr:hypothetical protein [Christensenellaceae bacterium]
MFPPRRFGRACGALLHFGLRAAFVALLLALMPPLLQASAAPGALFSAPGTALAAGGPAFAATAPTLPAARLPARGYWQAGVYYNPFAALAFAPPGDWQPAGDAELLERFGLEEDALPAEGAPYPENPPPGAMLLDMQAYDPLTGANLLLRLHRYAGEWEGYMPALLAALLQSQSFEYESDGQIRPLELAGQSWLYFSVQIKGLRASQLYLARDLGDCALLVNVLAVGGASPDETLDYFRPLES